MMPAVGDSSLFIAALKDLVLRAVGSMQGCLPHREHQQRAGRRARLHAKYELGVL